jgi:hypothetical protein
MASMIEIPPTIQFCVWPREHGIVTLDFAGFPYGFFHGYIVECAPGITLGSAGNPLIIRFESLQESHG